MSDVLNNAPEFFKHMQRGMQRYFDKHDSKWGGILHFCVGVKGGKVGGIIKSEETLHYEKPKKRRKPKNAKRP